MCNRVVVSALLLVVLALSSASTIDAQTVRGRLLDHETGQILPGGSVMLFDSADARVAATTADRDGVFVLRAPRAGVHSLYFSYPGYASVPSDTIRLQAGRTRAFDFRVPLVGGAAVERMSEVIDIEERLQSGYSGMCGEPVDPSSGGIVVGVVRHVPGNEPIAGAIVRIESRAGAIEPFHKATVSSANGVYVLCNIPAGTLISRTQATGYRVDRGPIAVRAGQIAWYDVLMRTR